MKKKELTFKQVIAKIKANLKRKDAPEICASAGFCTPRTFYTACKKNDWGELTVGQRHVIDEALKLITEREQNRKELLAKIEKL
jgi:hypothetical protein